MTRNFIRLTNLVAAVVLQDFSEDGVSEVLVHRDGHGVGHPHKQVYKPKMVIEKIENLKAVIARN